MNSLSHRVKLLAVVSPGESNTDCQGRRVVLFKLGLVVRVTWEPEKMQILIWQVWDRARVTRMLFLLVQEPQGECQVPDSALYGHEIIPPEGTAEIISLAPH